MTSPSALPVTLPFPLGAAAPAPSVPARTFHPSDVTLLGQQLMLEHTDPLIMYTTYDRKRTFYLSGGLAPWPRYQDGLQLVEISPPDPEFRHLDAQGARQDGVTWSDTVYDATEINAILLATARTAEGISEVVSDWNAAHDPSKLGRLEWVTFENGLWWADVRLAKKWTDRIQKSPRRARRQVISHVWRNDAAFWVGIDSTSEFQFTYDDFTDTFNYDTEGDEDLGPDWPQYRYEGTAGGFWYANGDRAVWKDDPDDPLLTGSVSMVNGPYRDFHTATDNQAVSTVFGTMQEFGLPVAAANDIWCRMGRNPDGTWNGYGVRARIEASTVRFTRFNDFTPTQIGSPALIFPPALWGEKWTLLPGVDGQARRYRLLRGTVPTITRTESGTGSALGAAYRGVGFGGRAAAAIITQATPGEIRKISAGDNATITQSGFCPLTNIGSQNRFAQFLITGPGRFEFGNGPGSSEMISFGPIDPGQQVLISTDPRARRVIDVTMQPLPSIPLNEGQKFVKMLADLVGLGKTPQAISWLESTFGIKAPQGNLYERMNGLFTRPIPGVERPRDAVTSQIAVTIVDGNADSRIVASVTPMRRWPE